MLYLIEVDSSGNCVQLVTVDGDAADFVDSSIWHVFDTYDDASAVLGKRWDGAAWIDVPAAPVLPPEPTQEELNNLLIMEGIAGLYEKQLAAEAKATSDNIAVMDGLAGIYEQTLTGGV